MTGRWMLRVVAIVGLALVSSCHSAPSDIGAEDAAPPMPAQRTPDANEVFLNEFLGDLSANRWDQAYAKMAASYRDANDLARFKSSVEASPYLSSARHITIRRTFGDDAVTEAWISTAKGELMMSAALATELGARRLLVLAIAGVPVLQGITAQGTEPKPGSGKPAGAKR